MSATTVLVTIASYFALLLAVSWFTGRKADNASFFTGGRKSPWWVVAIAMIGSSMSGVTFVSVPGMVGSSALGYMQMCLGFIAGYLVIAYVLTPLFFRLRVVSIYQYLESRFGLSSYKTGAWFFFISKMLGASVRLFLVCLTLQLLVFDPLSLPFSLNVLTSVVIVFLYTLRGGVKSIIWTDTLKTVCMVLSVALCIVMIAKNLNLDFDGIVATISGSGMSRVFFFDDPNAPQYFWKQFFGGMFTVIAMTGLDQDMMQRTLSCKDYRESQKNLITATLSQTVVIFLFLCLGVLLHVFAEANGIQARGDQLFPAVATSDLLHPVVGVLFVIGLVSCAYSAGGSALTSLTTSFTVDIIGVKGRDEADVRRIRRAVHLGMAVLMGAVIIVFNALNSTSAIDAVYKLASYTYGPILGMFSFGILTGRQVRDRFVPLVAVVAPVLCLVLQLNSEAWFGGYKFSYELLLFNALFTFIGLLALSKGKK